ncbi:hypothetical protein [Streptomyces uncialis]|uniref:hypothetical protein n=1 Tax=Streptomyces uncialis TaxID=1048205 RepID=UPI0037BB11B3
MSAVAAAETLMHPRSEFTGNSVDEMPQQDAIPCGGTATKLLAVSAAPVKAVGR